MSRCGLKAVKSDSDPQGLLRDGWSAIATYCNNTVVRIPPARSAELDKKLLRETGRRLAEGYIQEPPLLAAGNKLPVRVKPLIYAGLQRLDFC